MGAIKKYERKMMLILHKKNVFVNLPCYLNVL